MSIELQDRQMLGRRHFLKSLFGLGGALESSEPAHGKGKPTPAKGTFRFFWTDLHTGQIGFPSGQVIPSGMPGSLMKLVAAAALLESRIISPDDKFECRGTYQCGAHEAVHCLYPHGLVDLTHAIGLSCNIYFAQAAQQLSPSVFLHYAADFGLNEAVGSFASGKFPKQAAHPAWKYVLGLAPDFQPNALQIMRMSALIANKGTVPFMHSAEEPNSDGKPFKLTLSNGSFNLLQQGMEIACRDGTGKNLDPENKLHVALKTGTTPHGTSFQSWVTGYFPWQSPRYAFCLRSQAGTSYDQAIPALKKFLFGTTWP